MDRWQKTRAGPRAVDRAPRRAGPSAAAGRAALARASPGRAGPARARPAVRVVPVRAGVHPAAASRPGPASAGPARARPAVRVVRVRAAVHPAGVPQLRAGRRVEAAWLAALAPPVGLALIAVARPAGVAPVASLAALALGTGVRMRTVAQASARAAPRLPGHPAGQARADARPAPLAASLVVTPPAMPGGTGSRPMAVTAAAAAMPWPARRRRAGIAVWAGLRALPVGPVPTGPRARQAARHGGPAGAVASGERTAPGIATATRQPSAHRVQPLVSVGMPGPAAATAGGSGAATTGRGEARLSRGAASVATTVMTAGAAIALARGAARTGATTPRPAADRAAPAARRPGRTGMSAARRAGCPEGRTRAGRPGVRAPVGA
jgi:hypothetical protein